MNTFKSYIHLWAGLWIILFFIFLPFQLIYIPDFGIYLSEILGNAITKSQDFFGFRPSRVTLDSDTSYLWLQTWLLGGISGLISILLFRFSTTQRIQLSAIINTIIAFILSFFLIYYGNNKLFHLQFYEPSPNTLYTPVGFLSKDILFWTSMGTSDMYNTFMGIIEILPGILLLWYRTRLLGALIAMGVLSNVFMINMSFDISVKLLSCMLLLSSIYLTLPYLKRLWYLFVLNKTEILESNPPIIANQTTKRSIKGFILVIIFIETTLPYFNMNSLDFNTVELTYLKGSYSVELFENKIPEVDFKAIKRVHIHPQGYLIFETKKQQFIDTKLTATRNGFILNHGETPIHMRIKNGAATTTFVFNHNGSESQLITQELENEALPVNDDSFHWTREAILGD